jgi:hypothetical protein
MGIENIVFQLNHDVELGSQRNIIILKDWLQRHISCKSVFTGDIFRNKAARR